MLARARSPCLHPAETSQDWADQEAELVLAAALGPVADYLEKAPEQRKRMRRKKAQDAERKPWLAAVSRPILAPAEQATEPGVNHRCREFR